MNQCRETVLTLACEAEPLVGILAEPAAGTPGSVGVVILVGGPQYRAGSHRQFTLLARHLAAQGFVTLRFDYRGMGDSGGCARSFEAVEEDIAAAITGLLQARPQLQGVVLHGLCDAASAALVYCESRQDPRVRGLALQNPWFRSEQGEAQAVMTHYYGKRLRSLAFWKKLVTGRVGVTAAAQDWLRNRTKAKNAAAVPQAGFRARMMRAWMQVDLPLVLQLSHDDLTAREFVLGFDGALPGWSQRAGLKVHQHPHADHTFSSAAAQRQVHAELVMWLRQEVMT